VLSRQYKRAFLKRLAIDLIALFTYNIKAALANGKEVIIFTLNIQEAFDAILKKQLFKRITKQDWPLSLF
jgi:hypothetical protein